MIRRISVAAISLCVGACASSGPEVPEAAAIEPVVTASSAGVDAVAASEPSAPTAGELHELDAPNVPKTAKVLPGDESDDVVCRRERATGSKFSRTVCRSRADIEASAEDSQEALSKMRSTGTVEHSIAN